MICTQTIEVLPNPLPWRRLADPLDVNGDGHVVPLDVLFIINELNSPTVVGSGGVLPTARPQDTVFHYDVNGDGSCTSMDALWVINFLNSGARPEGEHVEADSDGVTEVLSRVALWWPGGLNLRSWVERDSPASAARPVRELAIATDDYFAATAISGDERVAVPLTLEPIDANDPDMELEDTLEDIALAIGSEKDALL